MSARLLLGDCLDLLPTLEAGSVDLVLADPPYGTTACKWDAVIPFAPMWEQLRRVAKPNAAIVLFASQPFTSALVMSNPREFRHTWVWDKKRAGNIMLAAVQPMKVHEDVCVFARQSPTYTPQKWRGVFRKRRSTPGGMWSLGSVDYATDERYPTSIIEVSNAYQHGKVHPTQKPVDLLAYLIRTYSNPGDLVLDFCMGSGTTGVACLQGGRDFIGIERERSYFEISERRIATAQPPLPMAAD